MDRPQRAAGFLRANEQLVATCEGLGAQACEDLRVPLRFLPEPADMTVVSGLRLNEAALHAWDIRVAFDPQAVVDSEEAGIALQMLTGPLSFLAGRLGSGDAQASAEVRLEVETTAPESRFGLVLGDGVLLTGNGGGDGVLAGPAEAILRLLSGRLAPAHTPESVELRCEALTLDQLRAIFPGF